MHSAMQSETPEPLEEVLTRVYPAFDPKNISERYRRRILNVIHQS